ncbi:MAG: acyl-CoA dehydrogenase family protein [Candidatus Alcyoniella australis]|nr:acyl-CoA dehydrogenase family protein [Candidatus Alcyoniella australis]
MFDVLLSPEERAVRDEAREFVKAVDPQMIRKMESEQIRFAREFVEEAGRRKLLGLRFPTEYGGRGLSWVGECAAIEEVGVLGNTLGCHYSMPSIVGEALNTFGTDEQKRKFLKPTCEGRLTSAEGLTEPRGGSDFFGATTRAVKDGNEWVLNGQKRFVVGAEGADYFLIYAKSDPEAEPHLSLSLFIVERDHGVKVEHLYGLMGCRGGGTGRIVFEDVRIPADCLVGPQGGGGMIFNRMMLPERMTSAAGAIGAGRAALEVAARYSNKRKAFGRFIRKFQAVSFKVADSVARIDAARALTYVAARTIDAELDARRMVSEAKKVATTAAWDTINDAMQVMGGIGYTHVFPVERLLRDSRLSMIWTGTNEIMSLLIQHEYYKELLQNAGKTRNVEIDAIEEDAEAEAEKIFE